MLDEPIHQLSFDRQPPGYLIPETHQGVAPGRAAVDSAIDQEEQLGGAGAGDVEHPLLLGILMLAVEALMASAADPLAEVAVEKGLAWLLRAVAENRHHQSAPIGFYFARLWYYESMYPLVFTLSALTRAVEHFADPNEDPATQIPP